MTLIEFAEKMFGRVELMPYQRALLAELERRPNTARSSGRRMGLNWAKSIEREYKKAHQGVSTAAPTSGGTCAAGASVGRQN